MNLKLKTITTSALIAAVYAISTYICSVFGLSFGVIQLRFSEALMALALYTPAAIPGLSIGCFLANLASPFGFLDIILGTIATLISVVLMRVFKNITLFSVPVLSLAIPAFINAAFLPLVFAISSMQANFFKVYFTYASYIFLEEFISCFVFGTVLYLGMKKLKISKYLFDKKD